VCFKEIFLKHIELTQPPASLIKLLARGSVKLWIRMLSNFIARLGYPVASTLMAKSVENINTYKI